MTKTAKTRGPKEQALKAKREEKALDIPDLLKRQPETPEQAEARRAKQAKAEESKRFADSAGLKVRKPPEPIDPKIAKAIARDLKSDAEAPRPQLGPAPKRDPMRVGKMSPAMAKALEIVDRNKVSKAAKQSPLIAKALAEREKLSALTKSNKSEGKTAMPAKTKKASNGKTKSKSSKVELIAGLLKRKEGCTSADVLKATGWPAVSMPQQAKAAGLRLKKDKKPGEVTRYFAA